MLYRQNLLRNSFLMTLILFLLLGSLFAQGAGEAGGNGDRQYNRRYKERKEETRGVAAVAYAHDNLRGKSFRIDGNYLYIGGRINDQITSIDVPQGYKVTLFYNSDYDGSCCLIIVGPYTINNLKNITQRCQNKSWNDTISSVKFSATNERAGYYQLGSTTTRSGDQNRRREFPGSKW